MTAKTQPPHDWAAPVLEQTADTLRAPSSTAARMSVQRTTPQWQTITGCLLDVVGGD